MKPQNDPELINLIKTTGEIYGKQVSPAAAVMFLSDLENYHADVIKTAMARCRKELRTFPSVADVIARVDDGRPGVEEAWSMIPKTEQESVVWTKEMRLAHSVCYSLIEEDPIAARMAFKERYLAEIANSRREGVPVKWSISLGFDVNGRAGVLTRAVDKKRISIAEAQNHLPMLEAPGKKQDVLTDASKIKQLISGVFKEIEK